MNGLGSEIAELVPLALVIALSPLSIIPGILMLHTPKPRPTSVAFLIGWTIGIAAVTAAFLLLSDALDGVERQPSWAPYVRLGIGVLLICFGIYRWVTRKRSAHTPGWMRSLTSVGPSRAAITAVVLVVVNVKVLLMCVAAGVAIGTSELDNTTSWAAVAAFTAISASTVALPVLTYLVAGEKLDEPLNRLKTWMEEQHAALVAGILVVLGLMLLYKGIHAL